DLDGLPFQPIEAPVPPPCFCGGCAEGPDVDLTDAADMVDGTFFMPVETVPINSEGVEFTFDAGDPWGNSWNHVLSNLTHAVDVGRTVIRAAGRETWSSSVGIHASSGITFDLGAIRRKHGAQNAVNLVVTAGTDGCNAAAGCETIDAYIVYSTDTQVLEDSVWKRFFGHDEGEEYKERIPPEAKFLTFAVGAGGDGSICCDHGVFADARIFPELPEAAIDASPPSGPVPLTVDFSGAGSTTPAGTALTSYSWDFGDGETATGARVSHTYATRGAYTAKLNVLNDRGQSDDAAVDITATFACQDVAPFVSADIGAPAVAGCARKEGDCLVVFGGGKDITQKADQFQLTHKQKGGDVTLTARITKALFDGRTVGRGGLMFRDGLATDAAFAFMHLNATLTSLRAVFLSRAGAGQTAATKGNIVVEAPDIYLKLERSGAQLIGSVSSDGSSYTEVHRIDLVAPPEAMLAGLAVTSRDSRGEGTAAEVTFCDVAFSDEGGPPQDVFYRGDADDNGQLQLTDAIRILGFLFLGGVPPSPPGPPGQGAPCGVDPAPETPADDPCATYTKCAG
ncbi:MAG: PKD domain-containing protein, partial [Planctomycetes bacterium]|nr:PKD domain-containing protein [Planctomycetota bacterium]